MNEDNKELLLKDLCSRLPYGVKVKYYDGEDERDSFDVVEGVEDLYCTNPKFYINQYALTIDKFKPYLFPLSSMTDKDLIEFLQIRGMNLNSDELKTFRNGETAIVFTLPSYSRHVDWLNAHHFDYRNLIDKNLAIDCTNLNIY